MPRHDEITLNPYQQRLVGELKARLRCLDTAQATVKDMIVLVLNTVVIEAGGNLERPWALTEDGTKLVARPMPQSSAPQPPPN